MYRRIGWSNRICLALLALLLVAWIRSEFAEDRFIFASTPASESWIAVAEHYPWMSKAPKVLSNIEYRELGIGRGEFTFARAGWAERDEFVPDYDPYSSQSSSPTADTPWLARNAPGFYHLRGDPRQSRVPLGPRHLGFSFGRTSGRNYYSGFPAQTWIDDITEFRVPFWAVAVVLTFAPITQLAWRIVRRQRPGTCAVCGYDLRASTERCPECGTSVAEPQTIIR